MNQAMLMKPPSILDEIISQDSENFTNKSNARSAAQKRNKKENTIRIGANSQESKNHSRQHDNESVHSNASGKSKGKKTKETTLARPKIVPSPKAQREEDNHSVHSTGSRHSHKSAKKENTIMPRPKIEGGIKARQEPLLSNGIDGQNQLSFKAAWNDQQESIIKGYEYKNQRSPQVMNYEQKHELSQKQQRNQYKQQRDQYTKQNPIPKYSPFAEIEHQYNSDDEPVIKLQQPAENKNNLFVGVNRHLERPKQVQDKRSIVENKPTIIESRLAIEQSNVVFGQSKLRETKSRRRNIFDKTIHENSSRVSNSIAQSSVSGLEDTTRRKSKSRLRQLFNSSREKKDREDSREGRDVKQSTNNMVSIAAVPLESKEFNQSTFNRSNFKPASGANDKLVQLQRKVLERDNDEFSLQESKSELNLSTSNNLGRAQYKDKDSLIFQFEPEKKKGMSVTSKEGRFSADKSAEQMVNLNSMKTYPNAKASIDQLPKISNHLNSKELQSVHKILKQNQEYLKNNQFKSQNPNAFKRQTGKEPYLFNIQDQQSEVQGNTLNVADPHERAWHQIVHDYQQPAIPIKTVQRSQKKINKDQNDIQRERQKQKQRQRQRQQQRQRQRERQIQEQRQQKERAQKLQRQRERERQRQIKEREEKQREKQRQLRRQQQQQQKEEAERVRKQKIQAQKKKQQQRRRSEEVQIEKQKALRQQEKEQRERRNEFLRKEAEKRQKERQELQVKKKKSLQVQEQQVKLNSIPSSYSRDDSENKSQKSNKSSKKAKQKKQTSLTRDKNHKVYVRNQIPRAQESFYESSEQEPEDKLHGQIVSKQQAEDKKPKLLTFSDDEPEMKPKSKTDMNFYDCTQSQKSIKPPSSKPPLSKRTNGSGGSLSKEKKPKEKTIAINIKEKSLNKANNNNKAKPEKKMTLMEKALMKHNQSNDSYSEDSYRNRENFSSDGSRRSNSSKNSRASLKKQSTINISLKDNTMIYSKYGKVPLQKKQSNGSSHEEEMQQIQRNRLNDRSRQRSQQKVKQMKSNIPDQRMIVSKNCTFIDEKGRLVQKDLIIKGKEVYGAPGSNTEDSSQYFLERMKRSREERKKRSRSRDKMKLSRKQSRDGSESGSCNQGSSYASSTFYENNSNYPNNYYAGSSCTGYPNPNANPLRQFIRPVEQVPMYSRDNQKSELPKGKPSAQGKTLNQMFYRKNTTPLNANYSNMSQSRKSLGRTQKSLSKR